MHYSLWVAPLVWGMCVCVCAHAYLFNLKNIHSSQTGQTHTFASKLQGMFSPVFLQFYLFFYHLFSESSLTVKVNK